MLKFFIVENRYISLICPYILIHNAFLPNEIMILILRLSQTTLDNATTLRRVNKRWNNLQPEVTIWKRKTLYTHTSFSKQDTLNLFKAFSDEKKLVLPTTPVKPFTDAMKQEFRPFPLKKLWNHNLTSRSPNLYNPNIEYSFNTNVFAYTELIHFSFTTYQLNTCFFHIEIAHML